MQKVAQSWLVFELTKSSFYLGLDDFLGQLPILLFTLIGGVIADRHDRRRLLLGFAVRADGDGADAGGAGLLGHGSRSGTSCAVVHRRTRARRSAARPISR